MDSKFKNTIYLAGACIFPILIALPFMISMNRSDLVEIALLLVAVIELLIWNIRRTKRDKFLYKEYGRLKSKETDKGYVEYKNIQTILVCSAILNITVSLIWYLIFNQWWGI